MFLKDGVGTATDGGTDWLGRASERSGLRAEDHAPEDRGAQRGGEEGTQVTGEARGRLCRGGETKRGPPGSRVQGRSYTLPSGAFWKPVEVRLWWSRTVRNVWEKTCLGAQPKKQGFMNQLFSFSLPSLLPLFQADPPFLALLSNPKFEGENLHFIPTLKSKVS